MLARHFSSFKLESRRNYAAGAGSPPDPENAKTKNPRRIKRRGFLKRNPVKLIQQVLRD